MADNQDVNTDETTEDPNTESKKKKGFGLLKENERREMASKGGKSAHEKGTAHQFDSETGREAGRKGGEARHRNSEQIEGGQM